MLLCHTPGILLVAWVNRTPVLNSEQRDDLVRPGPDVACVHAMFVAWRWSHRLGVISGPPVVGAWATCAGGPRSPTYADDLYRQLGSIEDLRNRRWQTSTSSIPDEIWVALLVLSAGGARRAKSGADGSCETHSVLMCIVATALGTLFWVAAVLEYPFCGRTGIGPGEPLDILRAHLVS